MRVEFCLDPTKVVSSIECSVVPNVGSVVTIDDRSRNVVDMYTVVQIEHRYDVKGSFIGANTPRELPTRVFIKPYKMDIPSGR